jgi:hypothetical protein
MSLSLNDILTAVIAAFAAGVPLLTFVYQYTLKPRLDIQIGQEVLLHYITESAPPPSRLIVTADFIFVNKGAQPAAMVGLFGTLWQVGPTGRFGLISRAHSPRPQVPNLIWRRYEKTEQVNTVATEAEYRTDSSALVETIIISGRDTSPAHKIRLYSRETLTLSPGLHSLRLKAIDGSARGYKGATLNCLLFLKDEDATDLNANGMEKDGRIQTRISLKRDVERPRAMAPTIFSRLYSLIDPAGNWPPRRKTVVFISDGQWSIS